MDTYVLVNEQSEVLATITGPWSVVSAAIGAYLEAGVKVYMRGESVKPRRCEARSD